MPPVSRLLFTWQRRVKVLTLLPEAVMESNSAPMPLTHPIPTVASLKLTFMTVCKQTVQTHHVLGQKKIYSKPPWI